MSTRTRRSDVSIRRRRKRNRNIILSILGTLLFIIVIALIKVSLPYETLDLCDMYDVSYEGVDNKGVAVATLKDEIIDEALKNAKAEYDRKLFHISKVAPEDYVNFRSSLNVSFTPGTGLSNGSNIVMSCDYDKELAKKLKLDIDTVTKKLTVNTLIRATVISNEQLFEDVLVTFSGISPNLGVEVINNSTHPFLRTVKYEILEPKDRYYQGEVLKLRAVYDSEEALKLQYVVEENASNVKEYLASSNEAYANDPSDITSSLVQEGITAGLLAFNNANEYGVRIFCEGHLVPVYINKMATFEWGEPRVLSAYFKVVRPENEGRLGYNYNDIDIIYEVPLRQADGVSCKAYCAVRFSNIIKLSDGTLRYDFSNAKILSASYHVENVKKNVVDSYTGDYEITKVY